MVVYQHHTSVIKYPMFGGRKQYCWFGAAYGIQTFAHLSRRPAATFQNPPFISFMSFCFYTHPLSVSFEIKFILRTFHAKSWPFFVNQNVCIQYTEGNGVFVMLSCKFFMLY